MARRDKGGMKMPLSGWGEQLRARKEQRRELRRRVAMATAGIALVGLTMVFPPAPRLVWNASASAPIGLYLVTPGAEIEPGDMVVARVPRSWRALAAQRHYLPANVPLVKRVAATAGDEVCALGPAIFINGREMTERHVADGKGRFVPWWNGCVRLRGRQLFVLMSASPASFDGRYFGVIQGNLLVGKARLLWPR